jgi:hypothetical protein
MNPSGVAVSHFGRSGIEMTMGMVFSHEDVVKWVEESCAAQGLSPEINDQQAMNSIVALLMPETRRD